MTPTIGDHVMMTVNSASESVADTTATVNGMIAAIEADLARIAERLNAARRAEATGVADTTRIVMELAALRSDTARTADRLATIPLETTPLALLSLDSEHLTLIKGIDSEAARILNDNGVHRFSDIAALLPEDVKELAGQLKDRRRIARECWIEQAALLAAGIETAHAARVRAGHFASVTAVPALTRHADAALEVTIETPKTAAVIDLASQRAERTRKSSSSVGQVGGMALAAALVLALTLNAGTLVGMAWGTNKAACGQSVDGVASAGKCTIAQLP